MTDESYEGWAILELMGHRRLAGRVSEQLVAGANMIRLDVPTPPGHAEDFVTQFYSPSALYCLTPTTEEMARDLASTWQPAPVQRWELPAARGDERDVIHTGDEFGG